MRGLLLINTGILLLLAAVVAMFFFTSGERSVEENITAGGTPLMDASAEAPESTARSGSESGSGSQAESKAAPEPKRETVADANPADGQQSSALSFPEWPKPLLALVITGEQLGYFEPCGCTANQLGGMSRRAELFRQISDLGWPVRGVDAGSVSRRSARQAQVKFETILTAMRELNYVGLGLGPEELRLDPGFLISQHSTDGENPLSFLSANLTFYGVSDLGTPLPWTIFEHNGLKVGIASVLGETRRKEVIPDRTEQDASAADIQWLDPMESLQKVVAEFDSQDVGLRILLSQALIDESRRFAAQFPSFDFIVTAPSFGDGMPQPELIGSVQLLQVGTQGKHAGVLAIYPQDAEQPARFELVTLSGKHFGSNPRMVELMQSYQNRLTDEQIVMAEAPATHPSGAAFVGAAKCGECHTTAYEIWQDTPHAHAFESLDPVHQRKGFERLEGVSRIHDPECLSCHVTGWDPQEYVRFRSGFLNREFAQSDDEKLLQTVLAGNQCENCHGPGSRHVELIEADNLVAARAEVRVTLEQSRQKGCMQCHDGENSPDFDFDKYWESVKHSGLD